MQQNDTDKRRLKLIVEKTPRCVKLLRFIRDHLEDVKELGIIITVTKAPTDPQQIKALARRGISLSPAMIGMEGNIYIGEKRIYGILQANFKKIAAARATARTRPAAVPGYDPNDLQNYWMNGLYGGIDRGGRPIPREDDETEEDDLATQLAERTRQMEAQRGMRSRGGDTTRDATRATRGGAPSRSRRGRGVDDAVDEEDNVGPMGGDNDEDGWGATAPTRRGGGADPPRLPPRQKQRSFGSTADMDALMTAAWMDNNPAME